MASLGILPKAQRLLDAIAGLAIGWYRIPTRGPQPAANPNNHYVLPQEPSLRVSTTLPKRFCR